MKFIKLLFAFFIAFSINGCNNLGPNYVKSKEVKVPDVWDSNLSKSDESIKEWWMLFNDKTLNTLVQKTYEQNLDLRSAGLRIMQSRAGLGIAEGLIYPQAQSLSAFASAGRQGGNGFGSTGVNFDVAWEMDVWGRYARNIESSEAILYASVASYDDILISIIAEVARNYINYRTAQERILFANRNILIQQRVLKITKERFNGGQVSELDMQQAKSQLFITKSLLPVLELSKIKSKNAIAVLLGTIPEDVDLIINNKDIKIQKLSYKMFTDSKSKLQEHNNKQSTYIPYISIDSNMKIDANLIRRRPDIEVAELQAIAQNARIGSAQTELYPHFSLFGTIGYNNTRSNGSSLSTSDAIGINVGPSFSWNIFQYDRIKNQVRLQDALFQESLINYNKKVLLAVQEVSNSLNGYRYTKEQLEYNEEAINATIRSFNLSMIQYQNGLVTYQRLLTSVQNLTRNEDSYAQIKGNIANYVISLYKALGGGWEMADGKPYVNSVDVEDMKKRTDWATYLDKDNIIKKKVNK